MKKLYKSKENKVLTGVIGGLGEYYQIDPTILRVIFIILVLVTGVILGILAYIIASLIIPEKPEKE